MTFEFQDYYSYTYAANDPSDYEDAKEFECYDVTFRIQDYTIDVVAALMFSYGSQLYDSPATAAADTAPSGQGPLTEYYEAAQEICSYNNIDQFWNEFFINAMNESYTNNATMPWNQATVIYSFHLDLLTDEFGGDKEAILENAKKIAATISPETGTLTELEVFYNLYKELWDTYYTNNGEFEQLLEGYWDYRSSAAHLSDWPPTVGSNTPNALEYSVRLGDISDPLPRVLGIEETLPERIYLTAEEEEEESQAWYYMDYATEELILEEGSYKAGGPEDFVKYDMTETMTKTEFVEGLIDYGLQEIYNMYCYVSIKDGAYIPNVITDTGATLFGSSTTGDKATFKFYIGRWWITNILTGKDMDYNANTAKSWSDYYDHFDDYIWGADQKYKDFVFGDGASDPELIWDDDDQENFRDKLFTLMCYMWPNSQNERGEAEGINWGNRLSSAGLFDDDYREWEGATADAEACSGWSWFRMYADKKDDLVACGESNGYSSSFLQGYSD
jgi:hypothetical protein